MSRLSKINGLPVVNATKPLAIEVTPRDVKSGDTKDPGACAVALACMHMGYTEARVHLARTYLRLGNKWLKFRTPQSIRTELISFDRGGDFQTGTYILSAIQPSGRTGKAHGVTKARKRRQRPGQQTRPYHMVSGVRAHGANR